MISPHFDSLLDTLNHLRCLEINVPTKVCSLREVRQYVISGAHSLLFCYIRYVSEALK